MIHITSERDVKVDEWTDSMLRTEVRTIAEIFAETTRHQKIVGEHTLPLWIQRSGGDEGVLRLFHQRLQIRIKGAVENLEQAKEVMQSLGFVFFVFSTSDAPPPPPSLLLELSSISERQVLQLAPHVLKICREHPEIMDISEAEELWMDPEFQGCESKMMTDVLSAARTVGVVDASMAKRMPVVDVFITRNDQTELVMACTDSAHHSICPIELFC